MGTVERHELYTIIANRARDRHYPSSHHGGEAGAVHEIVAFRKRTRSAWGVGRLKSLLTLKHKLHTHIKAGIRQQVTALFKGRNILHVEKTTGTVLKTYPLTVVQPEPDEFI